MYARLKSCGHNSIKVMTSFLMKSEIILVTLEYKDEIKCCQIDTYTWRYFCFPNCYFSILKKSNLPIGFHSAFLSYRLGCQVQKSFE